MLPAPRDPEIRQVLVEQLRSRVNRRRVAGVVLNEVAIMRGDYRVDVAVIADHFHGYEIKSDVDSIKRLPDQAKYFSYVFHRMTLVVGPVLLSQAMAIIPPWWGVVMAKRDDAGSVQLTELRVPGLNPKVMYRWVARLLWRDELVAILRRRSLYKGVSKFKHAKLAEHLRAHVSEDELVAIVSEGLRARTEWIKERSA